jgi:glycerol-3-phosphate acyltransferase PlsY
MAMTSLFILLAYAIGSIPFAYLLARRVAGIDIRRAGSGNIGAANVFRTMGGRPGVVVALLDITKGALAVLLARRAGLGPTACAGVGVAAVVGHLYPAWLRFRGGKGVATACGAFGVLAPAATGIACCVFLAIVWATRYVSLGSIAATVTVGPVAYLLHAPAPTVIAALFTAMLVVERHRPNLVRLRAGTERRLGERA